MEMMSKLPNVSKCSFFPICAETEPVAPWRRRLRSRAHSAIQAVLCRTKLGVVAGRRINPRIVGHLDIFG